MTNCTEHMADVFRRFALTDCRMGAPFYGMIAERISHDKDILRIAGHAAPQQPPPNMLLAAVLYLLNRGHDPELLRLYPRTQSSDCPEEEAYPRFRRFVLTHSDEIIQLLESRKVQSNVVRRAALLVFGLHAVRQSVPDGSLVNIEIGCSLGLTLGWQRFGFQYGDQLSLGDSESPVQVATKISGNGFLQSFTNLPRVNNNIGIEVQPVEIQDEDAVRWIEALIWPEHEDNLILSRAATNLLSATPPTIHAGDAADVLPELVKTLPAGSALNVYHSHSWNQMDNTTRERIDRALGSESKLRPVFRLSLERVSDNSELSLIKYREGIKTPPVVLAQCETHGRWIRPNNIDRLS